MNKLITAILLLIVFPLVAAGQDTKTIDLDPFNKIRVASEIDAELVLTTKPSLEINFNGIDPEQLIAEVKDQELSLRMKTGTYAKGSLKVRILFTDLIQIESTGRANIWSYEELIVPEVSINLSNGGSIRFKLLTDRLRSELIQGSILMLKGKAKSLDLTVSSGATFSAFELEVEEGQVAEPGKLTQVAQVVTGQVEYCKVCKTP